MIHHGKRDKQIEREREDREKLEKEKYRKRKNPKYLHLTSEERTTRVRKRPVVETMQNHLKISKRKTKKSTKQKINIDPLR